MDGAGVSLDALDRVGVVTGPGSFTGTRIGVAFARGLGLALGVPVIGVSALRAVLPVEAVEDVAGDLALVLTPAQTREPDLTFWGQVFCTRMPRSLPFEIGRDALLRRFEDWEGAVVADEGGPVPQALGGVRLAPFGEPALGAALAALTLDPRMAPPVPAYVREPDAVPRRAVPA
jgi:tRNA threonylcarbamoyladenosine biosynthesis protein TsaB